MSSPAKRSRLPHEWLLDASILFSFDASGYRRHARGFQAADLELDLRERVILVTGANSGLGYATARGLAGLGAQVHLLCRDPQRGAEAAARLRAETGNEALRCETLDVADLAAVRAYAERAPERIDALVHNAGVLPGAREEVGGLERTLATHVAGPLLLTQTLRGRLAAAPRGRVIWVSSGGMYTQRLSLDDIDWRRRPYDGVVAYAQTKRMQVALADELARRWPELWSAAMHPGWADTPGVRTSLPAFHRWTAARLRTAEQGADTAVWLAAAEAPLDPAWGGSGALWFDRAPRDPYLLCRTRESAAVRAAFLEAAWGWAGLPPDSGAPAEEAA